LGPRLALASLAALLIVVPFTLLLVLVENKWAPLARLDADAAATLTDWATRQNLTHFLEVVQSVSQPRWFQVVVALMALWFLIKGAHRLALWAAVTMAVGGLLGVLLKQLVARGRPVIDDPIVHIGGYSFPSGHALNSMLGVGVLLLGLIPLLGRRTTIVAWFLGVGIVLLVGFDRIALGAHYVSDVLAGWIVALAVLAATTSAFATWRSEVGRRPTKLSEEGVDPEAAQATTNDSDVNPDDARTSTKRT
jgi:undecaprenyl-diphosphatase